MQDIMQRLGMPADGHSPFDHNTAAIALAVAMNKARLELADRDGVKAESKTFAMARLEALRKALEPLYAAIPPEVDLFDLGLVTQERPRLFVDILAYVEMNRDQSAFRLMQETRGGRVLLAEAGDERAMIDQITTYVARRLVDRERRLAMEDELPPLPSLDATPGKSEPPAQDAPPPDMPEEIAAEVPSAVVAETPSDSPPRPAMPSALPITAAEAFRQWTGYSQGRMERSSAPDEPLAVTVNAESLIETTSKAPDVPEIEHRPVHDAAAQETFARAGEETAELMAQTNATTLAAENAAVATPIPTPTTQPRQAEIPPPAMQPVPKAATVAPALPDRKPMIRRDEGGRWFWPLFALLLGVGMGAAALYLYAASLVR